MSVVVRMEMPKSCEGCWMPSRRCKWRTLAWYLKDDSTVSYRNSRSPFCPIICSLPEGHGRLIDASYVIDVMQDELDNDVPITVDDCFQIGCKIPTIVPAEAESPSPKPTDPVPKPTDPVPIRDVYYVMTECDAKTGTVKYEPRERIEP